MKNICHQSMQNNLTSPSLTFKAWYSQLKEEVRSHTDVFTRNYIRRSVKGGRVSANINKFESSSINDVINILKLHLKTEENDIVNLMEIYNGYINVLSEKLALHLKSDKKKDKIDELMKEYEVSVRSKEIDRSDWPKALKTLKRFWGTPGT